MNKAVIYDKDMIYDYVKSKSVHEFLEMISVKYNISFKQIRDDYSKFSNMGEHKLKTILNAKAILRILEQRNVLNFIYTHKGIKIFDVLKNNGIIDYFKEIVTSTNWFERKPSPGALEYLIDKYYLNKASIYYIGDRIMDIEYSKNAGVNSVMLSLNEKINIDSDYIISDLLELQDII